MSQEGSARRRSSDPQEASAGVILRPSLGEVSATKSITVQAKQFHPVSIEISLKLPIEEGETPQEAMKRVRQLVSDACDDQMAQVMDEGWKWGTPAKG